MDSKNYFEALTENLKDKEFNTVLKNIDPEYEGKELSEVIDLLLASENYEKIEKLMAFAEKYEEDASDKEEDIDALEEEYQIKIDQAQAEEEEANRSRINHIRDFNDYNNQIETEMGPFVKDSINYRLKEVDEELTQLNRNYQLLDGQLSRTALNKKEKLEKEKDSLLKDKVDFEDFKEEARYLVKEDQKKIKLAQQKRNKIIEELNQKKNELLKEEKILVAKANKLTYIAYLLTNKLVMEKAKYDQEYNDIEIRFKEQIASNDYDAIAKLGNEFLEKSNKKKEYDKKFYSIFRIIGVDPNQLDIPEQVIESIEQEPIVETVEEPIVETVEEPIVDEVTEELEETVEPVIEEPVENAEEEPVLGIEILDNPFKIESMQEASEAAGEELEVDGISIKENPFKIETLDEPSELEETTEQVEEEPTLGIEILDNPFKIESEQNVSEEDKENLFNTELLNESSEEIIDYSDMISANEQSDFAKERCDELSQMFENSIQKPISYYDELTYLDKLENIIQLSNQAMIDRSIDEKSIIKTELGLYITADLIADYNNTIDKLEELKIANDEWNKKIMDEPSEVQSVETPSTLDEELEEDDLIIEHSSEMDKPVENLNYGFEDYSPLENNSDEIYAFNFKDNNETPIEETTEENYTDTNEEEPKEDSSSDEGWIDDEEDFEDEEEFDKKEEVEEKETRSEGIIKKLFGKKGKNNSEHAIKNVSEPSDSLLEIASDKFHKYALDEDGYKLWKTTVEEKKLENIDNNLEETNEGRTR